MPPWNKWVITPWEPPKDFAEFYERYPNRVRDFVRKKMRWSSASRPGELSTFSETIADYEQDLLLHLSTLPECNKYRRYGCTDRIQIFDPIQYRYDTVRNCFWVYINMVLNNRFQTIRTRESSDALFYADTLPIKPLTGMTTLVQLEECRNIVASYERGLLPHFDAWSMGETVSEVYRRPILEVLKAYHANEYLPRRYKPRHISTL